MRTTRLLGVEPTHFLVSYGHADLSVEEIVHRADTFEVVRKRGIAGEVADYLDSTDKSDPRLISHVAGGAAEGDLAVAPPASPLE